MKKLILALFILCLPVDSEANNGKMLYESMTSKDAMSEMAAEGFITGVYSLMIAQRSFCPGELPHDLITGAIGYFLQESPEYRDEPASIIIYSVLSASWPCKEETE